MGRTGHPRPVAGNASTWSGAEVRHRRLQDPGADLLHVGKPTAVIGGAPIHGARRRALCLGGTMETVDIGDALTIGASRGRRGTLDVGGAVEMKATVDIGDALTREASRGALHLGGGMRSRAADGNTVYADTTATSSVNLVHAAKLAAQWRRKLGRR